MSEEMNAATQTAAEAAAPGVNEMPAAAENGQIDNANEATFSDTAPKPEGTPADGGDNEGNKGANRDANAQRRRETERRQEAKHQRELNDVRNNAIIEALGGKNPYTDGEMKDADDVAEFLAMREIEKNGGDPVSDYSKHVKEKAREQRETEQREAEKRAWFEKDRADFAEKYPDADLSALIADKSFRIFAEGKVGERPLSEIYESYLAMTGEIEAAAKKSAAQTVANSKASPGSLSGGGQVESDFFTKEQVQAHRGDAKWMKEHYDSIRKSMTKW